MKLYKTLLVAIPSVAATIQAAGGILVNSEAVDTVDLINARY